VEVREMTLDDHSLGHAIELYLTACRVEGKQPNTVVAYRETLMMFLGVAQEMGFAGDVRAITTEHIYQWLGWVKDREVTDETLHRRHREAKFVFVWLQRIRVIDANPFDPIKNVQIPKKVVEPIKPEHIRKLLNASFPNEFLAARNRAIIMLFLDTGIRLNELISLQLDDLDIETQRLRILNGKMKKQRVVGVGDAALEYLKCYLEVRGDEPGQLFLSKHGRAIRPNSIRVMLRRLAERAGVPHVHPHKFRHTFATWAIESEAREIDVQFLLGHSTPVMVRRYASSYNAEKAARAHAKWSPGDKLGGASS
jgi:site-specific recombinase XerC